MVVAFVGLGRVRACEQSRNRERSSDERSHG
jgi:hypothetical protein